MKKELTAAALLLLLFLGAWLNVRCIDGLIDRVDACLTRSENAMARGDTEEALSALDGARRLWEDGRGYTGIFLNHRDLDSVYEAFSALEELLRQEDRQAAPAGYARLQRCLTEVLAMERLSLRSVL